MTSEIAGACGLGRPEWNDARESDFSKGWNPRSPGLLAFEPREGGRFTETLANGKVFEIGKVTTWEPGSRLAFSWRQSSFRDDQITHVEIRFEPIGEETRITVEHLGWDSVPQEHVARHGFPEGVFLRRCGEWWQTLLAAYRASVG